MARRVRTEQTRAWLVAATLLFASCAVTPRDIPRWQTSTLGLCEDYPEETRSLSRAIDDLAFARTAGAKVLRIAFGWDAMEPRRGEFDWSFWDDFVRSAAEQGITLIPYVCYTPRWAARDPGENFWRSPPRDPEDFGRFMGALVRRYGAQIRSWELWNEPDNPAYWLGTASQFAEMVRAGSRAVRAADPRATVVLGGIATEIDFLEKLFRDERIAPAVDVVNLHSYFETWHPDPIESLPHYVARAAEVLRDYGENEPLWLAETGYSSVGQRREISSVYRAHFAGEHTPEAQAAALLRTTLLALSTQQLPLFAWYRINDLPAAETVIGDDNNRHLGLRTTSGTAKPTLAAFSHLAALFGQPYRVLRPEVQITAATDHRVQAHAFRLRDGRCVVGVWIGMPAGAANAHAPSASDPRRATVRIALPAKPPTRVHIQNATGRDVGQPDAQWKVSATTLHLELNVRGSDVLLAVIE
jgi:hypothetical protein